MRSDLLELATGSLPVIRVFQTNKLQIRKLRCVSFHVDFRLARQIGRVVSEPKVITYAENLAGRDRVFVDRPDTTCTVLLFASKVLNHPDVVG